MAAISTPDEGQTTITQIVLTDSRASDINPASSKYIFASKVVHVRGYGPMVCVVMSPRMARELSYLAPTPRDPKEPPCVVAFIRQLGRLAIDAISRSQQAKTKTTTSKVHVKA